MKKLLSIYCLISFFTITIIAQSNPCGCITSHTPKLEQIEMFFPPSAIKKANIETLVLTSYQKDTTEYDSTTGERQQILLFDKDGYLRSEQNFTNPKFPTQTDFKRNAGHQIIQKTTFNLDDTGNPRPNTSKMIIDISYLDEWTTKTKTRDFRGNILADSISNYAILKKDKFNRWESAYYHSFYVGETYIESKNYAYDDASLKGVVKKTNEKGLTYKLSTDQYNANWQPITQTFFTSYSSEPSYRETSKYNDNQQLTYRKVEPIGIAGTECPDKKNYELFYDYSSDNLLKRITYTYNEHYCILSLKYE